MPTRLLLPPRRAEILEEQVLRALVARQGALALPPDALSLAAACGFPALDPWQVQVLKGGWSRLLLNCCRQSGKSTITALLAIDVALRMPRTLVLLLSPGERQSTELLAKVRDAYAALGRSGLVGAADAEGARHLTLPNGARLVALPGGERSIRGFSAPALVVLDEASRIDDALYHAVSPMLAVSGGRLIMLSTPAGKRGIFYEAWTQGGAAWQRIELPAAACPRYTPAFLAQEQALLPAWVFRAEYQCAFEDTTAQIFATVFVDAALAPDVAPLELAWATG
jgi:hypothetical protein